MFHSHLCFFVANRPENFLTRYVTITITTGMNAMRPYLGLVSEDGDVVNILGSQWSETVVTSSVNRNLCLLAPRGGEKIS